MTEVWKSQGRKFCELCKCWFGDNRASLQHHESGQRHKAAVAAKLRDLGKSNQKKKDEAASLAATLAAMEHGALASMKKNDEGVAHGPALPERGLAVGPRAPVGGSKYLDPRQFASAQAMASEMSRRKQEEEEKKKNAPAKKSSLWRDDEASSCLPIPKLDPTERLWVETDAEDGTKYYYHMYSGATAWEAPGPFFTQKEYEKHLAQLEQAALQRHQQGIPSDPSRTTIPTEHGEIAVAPPVLVAKRKERRAAEEIEETVKRARIEGEEEEEGGPDEKKATVIIPEVQPGVQHFPSGLTYTPMPERTGPSIFFGDDKKKKKRKGDADIPLPETIPLPPEVPTATASTSFSTSSGKGYQTGPAVETKTEADKAAGEMEEDPVESEVKEEAADEEKPQDVADLLEKASKPTPFGAWKKVVKQAGEKPAKSPLTARDRELAEKDRAWKEQQAAKATPPEPKIEFTEKTAPVTKKKNTGPVEFKKRTAPKSMRQRAEE